MPKNALNKLLIILLLIPMVSFGESKDADLKGFIEEAIERNIAHNEIVSWIKERGLKLNKEHTELLQNYKKTIRLKCAYKSEFGKTDFTAKKIYETCLDKNGVEDK